MKEIAPYHCNHTNRKRYKITAHAFNETHFNLSGQENRSFYCV